MTKSKLHFIVLLVSMALLFLIVFQIFWIKNSHAIYKQQLEEDVNRAMNIALEAALENKYQSITKHIKASELVRELDEMQKGFYGTESNVQISFGDKRRGKLPITTSDSAIIRVFSTLKNSDNLSDELEEVIQILETTNQKNELLGLLKNEEIQKISHTAFNELDFEVMQEVLKQELDKVQEIKKYTYGIFEESQKKFIKISNIKASYDLLTNEKTISKSISLPDTTSLARKYTLKVQIMDENSVLLKQMLPSLLVSFFLVLVVGVGYYFTISTILKQKKLSDIKTDFINNMTHELKTPITNVSLSIESLQKFNVLENSTKTKQYLNIAKKENNRLSTMVDQILNISLFEHKQSKKKQEEIDIHQIIKSSVAAFLIQAEHKNGNIKTDLTAVNHYINGNRESFANVILNLIDNGIKYSFRNKPNIIISTNNFNESLIISVKDHGIGIPKKYIYTIFDKFFRVPTGDIQNVKGFGLGLSYVQHIIQYHGGTIKVKSELGKGSEFNISIPVKKNE